jgi:2-methylisocitrate lyase-like PEP mutase family enzyme
MTTVGAAERARTFLALHHQEQPLLLANAWDAGSARLLAWAGFQALATTSAGHAATLGRLDGRVTLDEAVAHAADLVAATPLPVSCDFENCFADEPEGVAANVRRMAATGVAGVSVEDASKDPDSPIYDASLATERVAAAVEAAHSGDTHVVVTARADSFFHGRPDLDDTITRLRAFADAGADVVYAPGVSNADDVRRIVNAVDVPVNVLAIPGLPAVAELLEIGVRRISVGSGFTSVAFGAVVRAARELLDDGTYGFWTVGGEGMLATHSAFAT